MTTNTDDKGGDNVAPARDGKQPQERPKGLCPSCDEPLDDDGFCGPCDAIFDQDGPTVGDGRRTSMADRVEALERKVGVLDDLASIFGVDGLENVNKDQVEQAKATLGGGGGAGILATLAGMFGGGGGMADPFSAFFGQGED